jgi:hypothetical protein
MRLLVSAGYTFGGSVTLLERPNTLLTFGRLARLFRIHRLNMDHGGRSPKFIWAPCHVMCTAVLIG